MPPVSELSDDDVIRRCRDPWTFGGFATDHMHDLLRRALPLAPDDPAITANALHLWSYFAMPVAEGYSSVGPDRAEGIPLHRQALANAERILAGVTELPTEDLQALFFWATQTRMLLRLTAPSVSAEELALAGAESDAVYDAIFETGLHEALRKRIDNGFRTMCSTRRRALELVVAGPPYPAETVGLLANYLDGWDWGFGWPVAPLVTDPTFRSFAERTLAERSAARSHPPPTAAIAVKDLLERDQPAAEEITGRLYLALWLGVDQDRFFSLARQAIEARAPRAILDTLLALGFDANAVDRSSKLTLLHVAVAAANTAAITRLLAAGADPRTKAGAISALGLAKKKGRAAVLEALAGGGSESSSAVAALAAKLRATAAALDPDDLVWIGSTFGISTPRPSKILEEVLATQPATPAEILEEANARFIFDRYVIARLLRDAGYVIDVRIAGGVLSRCVTASGTITVDGDVIDEMGATLVAANDVIVHGGLMTTGDTIVGGTLRARDFVWGTYNDGSLVVDRGVTTPLLVMTDHTFECEGELEIGRTIIDERSAHASVFVPAVLDTHGTPDYQRAKALVRTGAPVVLGTKKVATKRPPAKKPPAKKPPAKKPPAKKAAAKKAAAKKPPPKKAAPAKRPAAKKRRR